MGQDLEIFPRQIGGEVSFSCAAAFTVLVGDLVFEGTLLFGSIVIGIEPNLMQGRGIEEQFGAWALVTRIGNVQWAALPVEAILELFVVFSALEQRQHLIVRPAGITKQGPVVVIPPVSSHIAHRIDAARST